MMLDVLKGSLAAVLLAVTVVAAGPAQGPAGATVHIRNFAFVPASVTIVAGETVRFVNDDQDAHTVTAADKTFDSGGLDTGEKWDHTFSKPGTYAYFCALHPYMHGTIVVRSKEGM